MLRPGQVISPEDDDEGGAAFVDEKTTPNEVSLAPVDHSPERPLNDAVRSEEETVRAEARSTVDQIPDYHETHPTLETEGPEHDSVVQERLRSEAQEAFLDSVIVPDNETQSEAASKSSFIG